MAAHFFNIDTSRHVALPLAAIAQSTVMRPPLPACRAAEQARAVNAALTALNAALAA